MLAESCFDRRGTHPAANPAFKVLHVCSLRVVLTQGGEFVWEILGDFLEVIDFGCSHDPHLAGCPGIEVFIGK